MGIFRLKKNKKYGYTPRFYKGEGSPYELKHKFDDYRKTVGSAKGIKGKWNEALDDYKYNKDGAVTRRVYIIIGILVLIFLYIIDFDISIFYKS